MTMWLGKKEPPGLIGLPATDMMWTETAIALRQLEVPPGSRVEIAHGSSAVVFKRNQLVARFLEVRPKLEWLLFLDSDMLFPASTVRRLLKWDRDLVSGSCVYKQPPYARVVQWLGNEGDRSPAALPELVEVGGVGAACLMIKRRVVEDLVQGPYWFEADPQDIREDVSFSRKVRDAGGKIFLDTRLVIGHVGPHAFVPEDGEAAQIMGAVQQARRDRISSLTINV